MKNNIKSVVVLTAICLVVSVILAGVNFITAPVIAENDEKASNASLAVVMPEGGSFEEIDITAFELPATVIGAFKAENGGHVIKLSASGYGSDMIIMCGVNAEGTITGAECISSNETLGFEKTYGENFKDVSDVDSVDTIATATLTTTAYKNAVKDAQNANIILSGGSVDIRTEEQILADNLAYVLPEAEGAFTEVFIAETVDSSVSKIFEADNGSGYVVKFVGADLTENFVSVDKSGKVINSTVASLDSLALEAVKAVTESKLTEIDLKGLELSRGLKKSLEKAYVTDSGNYVFELKAEGYGIKAKYGANGVYIRVKIAISADGVIISCVTTEQAETENIGDVCGKESYYSQYNGKDAESYKDVEVIAGASDYTEPAYKGAVRQAFEAYELLKGGLE